MGRNNTRAAPILLADAPIFPSGASIFGRGAPIPDRRLAIPAEVPHAERAARWHQIVATPALLSVPPELDAVSSFQDADRPVWPAELSLSRWMPRGIAAGEADRMCVAEDSLKPLPNNDLLI